MDAVWPDCIVEENNLAQAVSKLRQLVRNGAGAEEFIVTVPGRGYRFVAEVKTANGTSEQERPRASGSGDVTEPPARGHAASIIAPFAALVLLGAGALFWWRSSTPSPAVPEKSIAVLPFTNLSSDPETAYFAEGMKDEILTRLSKVAALKVISRTSTQQFASKPHNVREIARRLGVVHVLEGSVQKAGEATRVTVQLIHAPSDTYLWAESYDRKLTDVLQVESEIAQRIARALEATVTGAEKRALTAAATSNVAAYEAYLRGRYFWNKRTHEGFKEAVVHLSRAVAIDPAYAQAYAGLADAISFRGG